MVDMLICIVSSSHCYCLVKSLVGNLLSEIKFTERESAILKQNNHKEEKEILPFVTQYQHSVSTIKEALMEKKSSMRNEVVGPLPYSGLTIWFFADVSIFGDLDLSICGL